MAKSVSFEIEGVDALVAKLKGLDYDMKRKGGRFALRRAANLVRDDAKQRAERFDDPSTQESIAEDIAVRWDGKHFRRTGDLKFRVGVLGKKTFYYRFLELGTEKMRAQPFLRPALAENIEAATNTFVTEYGKHIDRALRRAARKAGKSP